MHTTATPQYYRPFIESRHAWSCGGSRSPGRCAARSWIEHAGHRARAIDIGERLEVLKDYPTPPNCTSPFAPVWIAEMVRRQEG